jgi:hypothetical protein
VATPGPTRLKKSRAAHGDLDPPRQFLQLGLRLRIPHILGCRAADPLQKLPYRHKAKTDDRSLVPTMNRAG